MSASPRKLQNFMHNSTGASSSQYTSDHFYPSLISATVEFASHLLLYKGSIWSNAKLEFDKMQRCYEKAERTEKEDTCRTLFKQARRHHDKLEELIGELNSGESREFAEVFRGTVWFIMIISSNDLMNTIELLNQLNIVGKETDSVTLTRNLLKNCQILTYVSTNYEEAMMEIFKRCKCVGDILSKTFMWQHDAVITNLTDFMLQIGLNSLIVYDSLEGRNGLWADVAIRYF